MGALQACYSAKRGHDVELYELRDGKWNEDVEYIETNERLFRWLQIFDWWNTYPAKVLIWPCQYEHEQLWGRSDWKMPLFATTDCPWKPVWSIELMAPLTPFRTARKDRWVRYTRPFSATKVHWTPFGSVFTRWEGVLSTKFCSTVRLTSTFLLRIKSF